VFPDGVGEVLAALPVGVFVTDGVGRIKAATPLAVDIAGLDHDGWQGKSVLDLADPDEVESVVGHLVSGHQIGATEVGGPHTFHLTGNDGVRRSLEVWSRNRNGDGVIDGFALVVTYEATNRLLLDVVQGVAAGDPVPVVMEGVAQAMRGLPVEAGAAIFAPGDDGALVACSEVPDRCDEPSRAMARRVLATGEAEHHEDLDGAGPAWCHAVVTAGTVRAALVVWPTTTILPTLNQAEHLERAIAVLDLAITRDDALAELQRAASHDDLTGLLNRAGLHARWGDSPAPGTALLYVDLDGFKPINDALGHQAGDEVLVEVAGRMRAVVRPEDDVVRLGGDEFAVVCPGVGTDEARAIAERLVRVVSAPVDLAGGPTVAVTASVGVTGTGTSLDDLVARADAALYEAKRTGGARVVVDQPERTP
jgi:diguanylate cyclase (GGDEF)-like protein